MKEIILIIILMATAITNVCVLIGNSYFLKQSQQRFICWKIDEVELRKRIRELGKSNEQKEIGSKVNDL